MLSLVFAGSLVAAVPPALPPESEPAPPPTAAVEADAPIPDEPLAIAPSEGALPVAEEVIVVAPSPGTTAIASGDTLVLITGPSPIHPPPIPPAPGPRMQAIPAPPWSGTGRFVGGAAMLAGGLGLLTAATFEFSDGFDTTRVLISQIPAGVVMLVAGGVMIGTGVRDQRRLGEWESATKIDAPPTGNGLIVGGITAISLGSMAAIATSIAADMNLNAPRSLPAGWATAGVTIGAGTALLVGGIVRRSRYGKWRNQVTGMPMVAPTRAGATIGLAGKF